MVFADVFGLGDSCRPLQGWPTDDGDHVLSAEYDGALKGTMLLAVNSQVATRLQADPDRLARGFAEALAAFASGSGVSLELGDISSSDLAGEHIVEICDDVRRCALFGVAPYSDQPASPEQVEGPPADVLVPSQAPAGVFRALGVVGESSLLDDVAVSVSVELGRSMMPLREILAMQPGMVIQLETSINDPVDVRVEGRSLAAGHVVTVGENFGVRIEHPGATHPA